MLRTNFNLREAHPGKYSLIYLVCRYNGEHFKLPTGRRIKPEYWNYKKQIIKPNPEMTDINYFNDRLKDFQRRIVLQFNEFESENGREPSRTEFNSIVKVDRSPGFYVLYEEFIMQSKDGTYKSYQRSRDLVKEFNPVLTFNDITMDFYNNYLAWLEKVKRFKANSVGFHIKNLKIFLNYCTELGHNKNMAYKSKRFKMPFALSETIYLNEKELMQLYALDLSSEPSVEQVRDLFIIGARTGLRYSDFVRLRAKHLKGNKIHMEVYKTKRRIVIPVHNQVKELFAKYGGEFPSWDISNAVMNNIIKKVCKLIAALNETITVKKIQGGTLKYEDKKKYELVTTHTARRSFASNNFLSGVPVHTIRQITGHSNDKNFYLYIRLTPTEHADLLSEHWEAAN